jgi:hypothetical protein
MAGPTTTTAATNSNSNDSKRRGKKDTKDGDKKEAQPSYTEHLERAQAAVIQNQAGTNTLHGQWRTHLVRMSYMLLVISLHQSQGPTQACLQDIKAVNAYYIKAGNEYGLDNDSNDTIISGYRAILIVLYDGVVSVLGLIMAAALTYFTSLNDPPGNFSSPSYMLAVACVPPIISLHFNRQGRSVGCLDDVVMNQAGGLEPADRLRGFPVVLVFFLVLTVSYWFMDMQMQKHGHNVKMVLELQKDLQEQDKAKKQQVDSKKKK